MLFTDLFNMPTFQAVELTDVIRQVAYQPSMLGAFGEALFATSRVTVTDIALARSQGVLSLIPTTPRGAPPVELEKRPGDIRRFGVHRLAKGSTITADSLTGVLNLPDLQAVGGVQAEFAERSAQILRDMEFTHEYMRFGAVMGRVFDADGSLLDDFWESWGVPMAPWLDLPLGDPDQRLGGLRALVRGMVRAGKRSSKGGWIEGRTRYHALCGENFFNALVTHPAIETTYLQYQAAAQLRDEIEDQFPFGGVMFYDYRGDDDGVLAIPDDEAHIFPVGGNQCFRRILGPAEFQPWIGLPGEEIRALTVPDRDRGAFIRYEGYCYPLYVCSRPEMLRRVRIVGAGSGVGPGDGGEAGGGEVEETPET